MEKLPVTGPNLEPYRQLALNVGANFAQSIAAETFKQTVVANAGGLAAMVAYLSQKSDDHSQILIASPAVFLVGIALTLLGLQCTYAATARLLRKMLAAAMNGETIERSCWDKLLARLGDIFGWAGVAAFVCGAALGALGIYLSTLRGVVVPVA